MQTTKNWFEVSNEGMKRWQKVQPLWYAVREPIQNALDEPIQNCIIQTSWEGGICKASVEDDSPLGFKKLSDAYTLFDNTEKRKNPEKRGIHNMGEKQALSICIRGEIETTKGKITFDRNGRHVSYNKKRDVGTKVTLEFKMKKSEYEQMMDMLDLFLIPKDINVTLNGEPLDYRQPFKVIDNVKLMTVYEKNDQLQKTQRNTDIHVHHPIKDAWIFEMGIPVMKIDCKYSIDIQQRIPMGINRDTISPAFMKDVFAEVLNATFDDIEKKEASESWVRDGYSDDRATREATSNIFHKRFGDKVVTATPTDPQSMDRAIMHGHNVVHGSEMSKEEWDKTRDHGLVKSSHEVFGFGVAESEPVEPNENMKAFEQLVKKIGKMKFGYEPTVEFVKSTGVAGQYGDGHLLVNVGRLGRRFFSPPLSSETLRFILHELPHEKGLHTEVSYQTEKEWMGAELIMKALSDPGFFDLEG